MLLDLNHHNGICWRPSSAESRTLNSIFIRHSVAKIYSQSPGNQQQNYEKIENKTFMERCDELWWWYIIYSVLEELKTYACIELISICMIIQGLNQLFSFVAIINYAYDFFPFFFFLVI